MLNPQKPSNLQLLIKLLICLNAVRKKTTSDGVFCLDFFLKSATQKENKTCKKLTRIQVKSM